jgi:hypothetical protein
MKRVNLLLLAFSLAASPCRAGGLTLTIRNGKVSIDAQEVTIRQILTEWARVGKTRIVNLERVTSGPMTLKFDDVPEEQALDIVLRTLPGYMAAPRAALVPDASRYDRILIMATTTAVVPGPGTASSQPFPASRLPFQSPSPVVTQLRPTPPMSPGILPEPPATANGQGPDMNDPAIGAAAAAGLIAMPGLTPGFAGSPRAPLQPTPTSATPPAGTPTPFFTAPAGTPLPAPPTPAPTPPSRPASIAPPQADR